MRSMILNFAVALAGCAGRQEAEPRTVRVEVPVAVLCCAECRRRIGYEAQLLAANRACKN
ncbi:TPA: hypothetical protein ACM2X8_006154 [Pseudomonas aeruginosa]|uniref:hypothetical protein n=1 Tax=Pseudomonas aeruginosa TaxID=287 RepID=UPI000D34E3C6|nr:hypothetical protein [Pseudomonas aeruginosa]MBG4276180.1 hypothetical protein [Pseudomonas aeruginosa]MBG4377342.1 hypothetical protein [Pseudomonas aeruginosa]MBG4822105.1 hypothetical protein [Pseudomonas aeruginosa]MBH4486375.1 hypothetical protein [Pseudomonas aeruginosa]MBH4527044.1 hypothetical protein [Pseudomonas aeruginosa]